MTKSIEELEIKVAFLEDSITKLSDEFYQQQRELDKLKTMYSAVIDKLGNMSSDESSQAEIPDERPPHY